MSVSAGSRVTPRTAEPLRLAVLALAGTVVALMQTLVLPIVAVLPHALQTTPAAASWATISTLIAGAVANPVLGRLGDRYGKRRVLLIGLGCLVAGSVVCATANSIGPLIAGRSLQGVALGCVALALSYVRDVLPLHRIPRGTVLVSATLGIGGGIGYPLGAWAVDVADWRIAFWVSAAIGVLVIVGVVLVLPETPARPGVPLDLVGAVLLSALLVCVMLAISFVGAWGLLSPPMGALVAASVALALALYRQERRTVEPMLRLRRPVDLTVVGAHLAAFCLGVAMFLLNLAIVTWVQSTVGGSSSLVAAACVAPGTVLTIALTTPLSRLSVRFGARLLVLLGAASIAVGSGVLALLPASIVVTGLAATLALFGVSVAAIGITTTLLLHVDGDRSAVTLGVNATVRTIGAAVGASAFALLVTTLPSALAYAMGFGVAALAAIIMPVLLRARRNAPEKPSRSGSSSGAKGL